MRHVSYFFVGGGQVSGTAPALKLVVAVGRACAMYHNFLVVEVKSLAPPQP